ncbi:MAG: LPS export ABC transporter periplasmic protein LptC [Marinobacter sp.]|nr:LPS export ABC transporter periplasmic protein LptC [Marinobacter sp.]
MSGILQHRLVRLLALALTLTILASLIWRSDEARDPTNRADLRGPDEPDGFVINGTFQAYSEQGQLVTLISSPRVEQFDRDNSAVMTAPEATLYDTRNNLPWRIQANEGRYYQDGDMIHLSGAVTVVRLLAEGRRTTLETESLVVDNQARVIRTDDPIVLIDARGVTRATGMEAWVDERVVELRSRVEGIYGTHATP